MTPAEAFALQQDITKVCHQKGVWVTIAHENKPDLKMIRIEISIKVEEPPTNTK